LTGKRKDKIDGRWRKRKGTRYVCFLADAVSKFDSCASLRVQSDAHDGGHDSEGLHSPEVSTDSWAGFAAEVSKRLGRVYIHLLGARKLFAGVTTGEADIRDSMRGLSGGDLIGKNQNSYINRLYHQASAYL
jgi:hypothetical protein